MSEVAELENPPATRDTPLKRRLGLVADILFYVFCSGFFLYLFRYYMTGLGGPSLLAVTLMPVTLCIVVLNDLRKQQLYPALGPLLPWLFALLYVGFSLYASYYLTKEFDNIRIYRLGIWNTHDLVVGGGMAALVLEYTRRHYFILFAINLLLILYTVYGYFVPGLFNHPGMPWERVISSISVEMSTGVFDRLAQLGLTLIGSFILVLAVLRAFGCIESILRGAGRLAAKSPTLLPQTVVISSFAISAVSGSSAANAATTGSATIPSLVRAGFPRVTAAAVETASSLGGQLMPPMMGIAAFLMAEYLQVSYFDVVARGFAPAIIYYLGVGFAVYLLALRFHHRTLLLKAAPMSSLDWFNIFAYGAAVIGLIYFMGVERRAAMTAAQTVFIYLFLVLTAIFLFRHLYERQFGIRQLTRPFLQLVEAFSTITADLVILLATLGILTASFTITGVPTKVGVLLMEGAGINMIFMVLVAFGFGYLVGMGLPVAPTYIITAVVVAPFMIRAGLDPWVVHFFAFFVAVFGELSPPSSVVAAVTSRIAEAPFVRTMMHAIVLCMPLMVLMAAVFTHPDLVVEPGWAQLPAFLIILIATLTLSLAFQGRLSTNRMTDLALRSGIILLALCALLIPNTAIAGAFAAAALVALVSGTLIVRRVMGSSSSIQEAAA